MLHFSSGFRTNAFLFLSVSLRGCTVGVIPGGTANVWAHEIGMSEDSVKASLLLVNSEGCMVDVGHVAVDSLPFAPGKKDRHKEERQARRGRITSSCWPDWEWMPPSK